MPGEMVERDAVERLDAVVVTLRKVRESQLHGTLSEKPSM
jgi:hypothetical protein